MAKSILRYKKSNQLASTSELVSEAPSKAFDDKTLVAEGECLFVTGMKIYCRRWDGKHVIGGLEVLYNCGKTVLHGSNNYGHEKYEFSLRPGEQIITINARSGWLVDQLMFTTSQGRFFGPYGGSGGGDTYTLSPADGAFLSYITGTVDLTQGASAVRKLCFVWGYYE